MIHLIEQDPTPSTPPANQERLLKAAAEMDAGAGTVHEFAGTEGQGNSI